MIIEFCICLFFIYAEFFSTVLYPNYDDMVSITRNLEVGMVRGIRRRSAQYSVGPTVSSDSIGKSMGKKVVEETEHVSHKLAISNGDIPSNYGIKEMDENSGKSVNIFSRKSIELSTLSRPSIHEYEEKEGAMDVKTHSQGVHFPTIVAPTVSDKIVESLSQESSNSDSDREESDVEVKTNAVPTVPSDVDYVKTPTVSVAPIFNSSIPKKVIYRIREYTIPPKAKGKTVIEYSHTTAEEFLNSTTPYVFHYHPPSGRTNTTYLFIVNFHWAKYKESVFIRTEYFKKFSTYFNSSFDMVMVGPRKSPRYHVLGNGLPRGGFYSYYSMPFVYNLVCVQRACNYDGFFFMNDDSYIDPQFLNSYNLSQSWNEKYTEYNPRKQRWGWYKARNTNGITFHQAYDKAISILSKSSFGKACKFEKYYNQKRGFADAFYLTAQQVELYNKLIMVMYEQRVFLEMASPTVMWCLTYNMFDDCNHGKMKNRKTCVHLHPVKYRQGNNKKFAMMRLDHLNLGVVPKHQY